MGSDNILVIKLGALGDFVQALGPMQAIRDHHPEAQITLLTTPPFQELAKASGHVDQIWLDQKPRLYQIGKVLALRKQLIDGRFQRVYDLQTSDRSSFYFHLLGPGTKPEWSGIAAGCSHPHANPGRDFMHTQERQREQLALAGITHVPASDLSNISANIEKFDLPAPYCLLAPGGAAHRPAKRWPVEAYGQLAAKLAEKGLAPVILGSAAEGDLAQFVIQATPTAIDLTGQTTLLEIAALAGQAELAVGNDTGPMHITSAAGCRSVVLFSHASDPSLCAPRSDKTSVLRKPDLSDLGVDDVLDALFAPVAGEG